MARRDYAAYEFVQQVQRERPDLRTAADVASEAMRRAESANGVPFYRQVSAQWHMACEEAMIPLSR